MKHPLTPDQTAAADSFMEFILSKDEQIMVLSGHSGTGKTTLTRQLIRNLDSQMKVINLLIGKNADRKLDIHITATTNKAARVAADMHRHTEAKTIYSLLGLRVVDSIKTGKTYVKRMKNHAVIRNAIIVVDEASFMNDELLQEVLASTEGSKVLLIGDRFQLVIGNVTRPPAFEMDVRKVHLTTVKRNQGAIEKLSAAFRHAVDTGEFPEIVANGKDILHLSGPDFKQAVDEEFLRHDRKDNDGRIMAWQNKTVVEYNQYIRKLQGLSDTLSEGERCITNKPIRAKHGSISTDCHVTITKVGEPRVVMDIPGRDYQVDYTFWVFVPDSPAAAKYKMNIFAKENDWVNYFEVKNNWGDLRPTAASTVHKSQGSTYKKAFINLTDIGKCREPEAVARMLYVAVSRASEQVILYGQLPKKYGPR